MLLKIDTSQEIRPKQLQDQAFIQLNREVYDDYIEMRLEGYNQQSAFSATFGQLLHFHIPDEELYAAQIVESVVYQRFKKRLNEIDITKLWNPQKAARVLAEIANDRRNAAKVRLEASIELNVVAGVTDNQEGAER